MTKLKTGLCYRAAEFSAIDSEKRTAELAFSSEAPVERFWGVEILDHSPDAIRLGRLESGGPVLVDHDPSDHVGVVESVAIGADRRGRATVRFGRGARATEVFNDVIDGIRKAVSVGYIIHRMEETRASKAEPSTFRAVDWEPLELSLVSIPADVSVGVGRQGEYADHEAEIVNRSIPSTEKSMSETSTPAVDLNAVREEARKAEADRVRSILAIGEAHNQRELAQKFVATDKSVDDFRAAVLESWAKTAPKPPSPDIGMSDKEVRRFSFTRAINALANPDSKQARAAAAFEFEASEAAAEKAGRQSRGITVPSDVLFAKRDLTTATTTGTSKAGYTVATDLLAESFIDVLRNKLVLQECGATFLMGLQGNVAIPKKSASATAYWVAENAAPTEGAITFGQVTMSPKTVAAFVDYGRRLMLQSSLDVEALVRNDLAAQLAVAIDAAAIGDTSTTTTPEGVRGTSGIGSIAIGTNGGAPTWASVCGLVKEVEIDNALNGSLKFLTNAKVRYKLATTSKQSSGVEGNFILGPDPNTLYGFPIVFSNQVPSTLTKGSSTSVCSAMFFGNWADLLIGQWGGIDLMVDPYTGSSAGTVRVVSFADVDVAVRRAESFAAVLDYTTT